MSLPHLQPLPEEQNELINIAFLITAIGTLFLNYHIICLFKKNDKELEESIKEKSLNLMYAGSFFTGLLVGFMPEPLNLILLVPTVIMFVAAETDMFMQQIYSFPCLVGFIVGIGILIFQYDIKSYFIQVIFCAAILLVFRIVKALNTGDIELILSFTPYLYMVSMEYTRPTFIESFLIYLAGSCVFALIINFRKYRKEKVQTFPFALPACFFYCSYIFVLSIINLTN